LDSTPRAYRLKVGNAAPPFSTEIGTTPERMFCRLKDYRRIATRYDRLARNFASAVALVSAITWWI